MKAPDRLPDIKGRWKAAQLIERWRTLPARERDAVMAELEENARTLQDGEPALAAHCVVALDVLDTMATDGALGLWSTAAEDVRWLIEEVERLRREVDSRQR